MRHRDAVCALVGLRDGVADRGCMLFGHGTVRTASLFEMALHKSNEAASTHAHASTQRCICQANVYSASSVRTRAWPLVTFTFNCSARSTMACRTRTD